MDLGDFGVSGRLTFKEDGFRDPCCFERDLGEGGGVSGRATFKADNFPGTCCFELDVAEGGGVGRPLATLFTDWIALAILSLLLIRERGRSASASSRWLVLRNVVLLGGPGSLANKSRLKTVALL